MSQPPSERLPKVALCDDIRPPSPPVLAVTVSEAVRIAGIGKTCLYEAIADGRLEAAKAGNRTVVLVDSLRAFIASLPRLRAVAREDAA